MDIPIEEHFDINYEVWTQSKCKWFLRFIQKNPDSTRIEKEPGEERRFLPNYLRSVIDEMDRKFYYEWESRDLDKIFVAIFRFLHKCYPEYNKLNLSAINDSEQARWIVEYQKSLKDKQKKKEARLQNQFIEEVNNKWLPGFEYLYNFEYKCEGHKGDLIFANNYGILAVVETKRGFFNPKQSLKEVKEQAIKYRDIIMKKTENDPNIITVIGVYFIQKISKKRKGFPLTIDNKIWEAIKSVYERPPNSDQQSVAPTIRTGTIRELEEVSDTTSLDEIDEIADGLKVINISD